VFSSHSTCFVIKVLSRKNLKQNAYNELRKKNLPLKDQIICQFLRPCTYTKPLGTTLSKYNVGPFFYISIYVFQLLSIIFPCAVCRSKTSGIEISVGPLHALVTAFMPSLMPIFKSSL